MWSNELTLISETYVTDEIKNMIPVETNTNVFCNVKSVRASEFYNAANVGLKPELVFVIHPYEYSGEKKVKFNDKEYRVIRTYKVNSEEMELTCERVLGNG